MDPKDRKVSDTEPVPEPRDTIPLPPLFLFEDDEEEEPEDDSQV